MSVAPNAARSAAGSKKCASIALGITSMRSSGHPLLRYSRFSAWLHTMALANLSGGTEPISSRFNHVARTLENGVLGELMYCHQ